LRKDAIRVVAVRRTGIALRGKNSHRNRYWSCRRIIITFLQAAAVRRCAKWRRTRERGEN